MRIFLFILLMTSVVFPQIEFEELLPNANVNEIVSDGKTLWFCTYGQGIHNFNPEDGTWKSFSTKNENLDNDLFYCIAASKEFVWAGTSDGLYIYDRKRDFWKKRKFAMGGEFGNWIRSLCYDAEEDMLYIGRFRYMTKLDVKKQRFDDYDLTVGSEIKTNTFKTIRLEGKEYVWFGTESGAFRYSKKMDLGDKKSLQYFSNKTNAFRGEGEFVSISEFLFEPNFIWFGTDEFTSKESPNFNLGGIYKFNRRATWERIDTRNGLPGQGIYTLARVGNYIWAAVYYFDRKEKKEHGRGLVLINRMTNEVIRINPDDIRLASNKINALYFDGANMWIGAENGLWRVRILNELARWTGDQISNY
ncbi:MAG: hypothetical protein GX452_14005 [Ignavibacteriales bacterium]|nr:hypothetical protein [Ignavibacteriaceae bacterium]NLH62508.1 hypothetical protein [Ignavibacteriales bacterium]HOJ19522.1 hypothetical protein [Ignavibacteriaceae bacterium]HPO56274.1 hypothetical protein [Ignavibacteriaceae bacterium]